jgi:glycosyltransferase involved in cell wall biosynthesis
MNLTVLKEYPLVLITSGFPFGDGEPFINSEIPHLCRQFQKLIIISQNTHKVKRYSIPDNISVYRYNPATSIFGFILIPFLIIRNFSIFCRLLQYEISFRKEMNSKLNVIKRIFLFKRILKGLQLGRYISIILRREGINENAVIYSYWLNTGAHAAALFDKPGIVKIARAHGSDLYEEKTHKEFLPLLSYCAANLDAIFFVSEDGHKYFSSKYPEARAKLILSRLGVKIGLSAMPPKDGLNRFVIVSCSNIIPLKRIDLIIKSIALIRSERKILWIHYGDGYLKDETVDLASAELGNLNNIEYEFRGQVSNEEIMKFYSETHVDLFINTSVTEGIPVSIMEAMAFGIPALATNVGGVNELVNKRTGILIEPDSDPGLIAKIIDEYLLKSSDEIDSLRNNSYSHCREYFGSEKNYSSFINSVNSILAQKKA